MIKCRYEDGKQAHLRHVTVDAIIVKDQKILMVKRSADYHIEPGKFALPGGFLDRDESGDQGIEREVLEETGYKAAAKELFWLIHAPRLKGDDRQNVAMVFIVDVSKKVQEPDHEIQSIHWFPLDKLPPENQIGFDHYDIIQKYLNHLKNPSPLPYIN